MLLNFTKAGSPSNFGSSGSGEGISRGGRAMSRGPSCYNPGDRRSKRRATQQRPDPRKFSARHLRRIVRRCEENRPARYRHRLETQHAPDVTALRICQIPTDDFQGTRPSMFRRCHTVKLSAYSSETGLSKMQARPVEKRLPHRMKIASHLIRPIPEKPWRPAPSYQREPKWREAPSTTRRSKFGDAQSRRSGRASSSIGIEPTEIA